MSLKLYEVVRGGVEPLLPPLYRQVRRRLRREVARFPDRPTVLDVGGRKSPYTIGVPARVTIIDLPRETEVQTALNLGTNEAIVNTLKRRRSNIDQYVIGDMTCSDLADNAFDIVVSVEVLEHVEADEKFVSEVSRVLKPGGRFIMTTPNGDFIENKNPDHKRHYKRQQLLDLLGRHFETVTVDYSIAGGKYRKLGLKSWSVSRPIQTISSIIGNVVNSVQSANANIPGSAMGTHHLFAVATRSPATADE